jgi:hypothetical protein
VHLSREFENFSSSAKTLARRLTQGTYQHDRRPAEPRIRDSRGPLVRSKEKVQTFLTDEEVNALVAMYQAGATVREVAEYFCVRHTTALTHLKRRSIPLRRHGLAPADIADATKLYQLLEVGQRFGVSQGAVRRALDSAGVTIRTPGRRVD